jgi:hypothetical protein
MDKLESSLMEKQESSLEPELNIFICENTDGVLDPMEQMIYALNELQVSYGSVVILKNAP